MGGNQISVKMPDLGQPFGAICVKLDAITYDHFGKEAVAMCAKLMTKGPWSGPRPRPAAPGATPPQPGGGLPERVCPVGPLSIVPRSLAGGLAPRPPGSEVTERRSLRDMGATDCAFS